MKNFMANRIFTVSRSRPPLSHLSALIGAAIFACLSADLSAQVQVSGCGGFPFADNGPYDYRTIRDNRLNVVERAHFKPDTEQLNEKGDAFILAADLDFTLRAFPNHHRALVAMMKLTEKKKRDKLPGFSYSNECYLERATRFSPDDYISKLLYAGFLAKRNRTEEASHLVDLAANFAEDNPATHYNIASMYFELKIFEKSYEHVIRAYEFGHVDKTLENQLRKAGGWKDISNQERIPAESSPSKDR